MDLSSQLHVADYVVLVLGIFVSMAAGMYYAFKDRHKLSSFHYHRGGGKLHALPVAMSMLVTFESSIFYLGYPAEVYTNGFMFVLMNVGMGVGMLGVFWIAIPFFYPLQVTSIYEYLQLRYDSLLIRLVAMGIGAVFMSLYSGIVLFGAAVALQSIINVPVWILIIVMTFVAVIYTSLGGLKAVVITDVIQGIIMIVMIFAVLIYGPICVGSVYDVYVVNRVSGRLQLWDFDPNPLVRHTFWTLVVGTAIRYIGFAFKQPTIQRFNSTKSIQEARKVAFISIPAFMILQTLVMMEGLVAFAYFSKKECDPLAAGHASNPNQIMIFVVMDMFGNMPGIPGLFLAALCSASLSTISSLLSSTSAIISEDMVRTQWTDMSERTLTLTSKVIVVFCGVVSALIGIAISQVKGSLAQITASFLGALDGPSNAIFIMSIFIAFTTKRGLLSGVAVGFVFSLWLLIGYNFSPGRLQTPWLPLGPTDACGNSSHLIPIVTNNTNQGALYGISNATMQDTIHDGEVHGLNYLYSISYNYFGPLSIFISLFVSICVSKITQDKKDKPVPSYLLIKINNNFFKCRPQYIPIPEEVNLCVTNADKNVICNETLVERNNA